MIIILNIAIEYNRIIRIQKSICACNRNLKNVKILKDSLKIAKYAKPHYTFQFLGQLFKYILFNLIFEYLEKETEFHINPGHNSYISKYDDTVFCCVSI